MSKTERALCAYALDAPALAAPSEPAAAIRPEQPHHRSSREAPLKPVAPMSGQIRGPTRGPRGLLKPALASILDACAYMGGISRAKFYADILPELETVKLGRRNFIVVASMDRLIEANRRPAG